MIKLEDVKPQRATFTLKSSNLTLTFRPFTLDDEIWMAQTYGEGIEKIFNEGRFQEIFRIAFRQIENKEDLKKRKVTVINEDGDEKEIELGGLKLLHAACAGFDEKMQVLNNLLHCIGISRPMMDDIEKEMAEADAKLTPEQRAEKKSHENQQITGKSSTSSHPNTDGPPNTSSP